MKRTSFYFLLCILLSSCYSEPEEETRIVDGMKPIYTTPESFDEIGSFESRGFSNLGKIVYSNQFIYINERYKGVHVIDNSDPSNPVPKHFWKIPGNIDFTIKQDFLYADNSLDLLVINIADPSNISVLSRIDNFYPSIQNENFPTSYNGFFECVDDNLGLVIGWELATLTNPKCSI